MRTRCLLSVFFAIIVLARDPCKVRVGRTLVVHLLIQGVDLFPKASLVLHIAVTILDRHDGAIAVDKSNVPIEQLQVT